jgi:D-lactate dehydrogenase (cytochrome)
LNRSKLSPVNFAETPTLFFKIAGPSKQMVADQIDIMNTLCARHNATSLEITDDESRIATLWGARKAMGTALVAMKQSPTDLFIHSDCAVPISKLPTLIAGTHELITATTPPNSRWFCANVGHAGDGNVHSSIICPAEDKELAEAVIKRICRLALSLEGTVTGEHGVGMKLRDVLEEEVGKTGVEIMRGIKEALDPRGILNPGKVFKLEDEVGKAKL